MTPKVTPEVEYLVKYLNNKGFSYSMIIKEVKGQGTKLSKATVSRILRNIGIKRQSVLKGHLQPPRKRTRKVLKPEVLRKIDLMTSGEDPHTQNEIARKLDIPQSTVNRGIKILGKRLYQKTRVHQLLNVHRKNRRTNCRKFIKNYMTHNKSEFLVTLDEALFFLYDNRGKRKVYYRKIGEKQNRNFVLPKRETFSKKFMVVAAISGRGVLPLIQVPAKVKVNSRWYVDFVLKPLLEVHLPTLYGNDLSKVVVHHDKASSHTAALTQAYARDLEARTGVKIIKNSEIPVKSPDTSPLDFFGFKYLKRRAWRRRPRTSMGLCRVLKDEWMKLDPARVTRVFKNWKLRMKMVVREKGNHIENCRDLHRKRSTIK